MVLTSNDDLPPGARVSVQREEAIKLADILLILLTPSLRADAPYWALLEKGARTGGKRRVVPIEVSSTDLDETFLQGVQLLPRDRTRSLHLQTKRQREEEWYQIALHVRQIVKETPRSRTTLEAVARDREKAGELRYRGRTRTALKQLRRSLQSIEEMIQEGGKNLPAMRREQALILQRIGHLESIQGHLEDAQRSIERSFAIRRHLAEEAPEDAAILNDIHASHYWLAYLAQKRGDSACALDLLLDGFKLAQRLQGRDPEDYLAARGVVVLGTELGTVYRELGENERAEQYFRGAIHGARRAALAHGEDQLQRDLSVAQFRLAELVLDLGKNEEALRLGQESVESCRKLVETQPSNLQWRRHLAAARLYLGDAQQRCGRSDLARGDYEFAAGTTGALVAVDRANRHTARDLSRAEARLGALAFDARDYGVAVPCYERAYHVLVRARSGMPALFRKEMDALRQEIDRMHKRIARSRSTSEDLRRVAADLARAAQEPG